MRSQQESVISDDDGDDVPLKYASSNEASAKNTLGDLLRHNIQTCEFCEARCVNMFDMLIHNSTHIIIPLIKATPHRCNVCDILCISDEHLSQHISTKHTISSPKTAMNGVKLAERIVFDNEEFEMDDKFENETLDQLIRKEQLDNGHVLQNLVMNCKVDVHKFDTPWLDSQKSIPNGVNVNTPKKKSVKNEPSSDLSILDDPIVLVTPMPLNENVSENKSNFESIHYDALLKPGIYYCKHCHKRFPNRYDVIIHELVHMDLSRVILSKKKKRKKKHSPDNIITSPRQVKHVVRLGTCPYCREQINDLVEHEKVCLKYICHICGKRYARKFWLEKHQRKKCEAVQAAADTDADADVIKLEHKRARIADRIHYEEHVQFIKEYEEEEKNKKKAKPLTNSERLKVIQHRLKLINTQGYASKYAQANHKKKFLWMEKKQNR